MAISNSVAFSEFGHEFSLETRRGTRAWFFGASSTCSLFLFLFGAVVFEVLAELLEEHEEVGGALTHVALFVDHEVVELLFEPLLQPLDYRLSFFELLANLLELLARLRRESVWVFTSLSHRLMGAQSFQVARVHLLVLAVEGLDVSRLRRPHLDFLAVPLL